MQLSTCAVGSMVRDYGTALHRANEQLYSRVRRAGWSVSVLFYQPRIASVGLLFRPLRGGVDRVCAPPIRKPYWLFSGLGPPGAVPYHRVILSWAVIQWLSGAGDTLLASLQVILSCTSDPCSRRVVGVRCRALLFIGCVWANCAD